MLKIFIDCKINNKIVKKKINHNFHLSILNMQISSEHSCSEHHGACSFSKTDCCWCLDKRTTLTIYLDSYDIVEPKKHGVTMPRDLYYCVHCKSQDTQTVGAFTQYLRDSLPNPSEFFRLKIIDDRISTFKANLSKRRKLSTRDAKQLADLNDTRSVILNAVIKKSEGKTNLRF